MPAAATPTARWVLRSVEDEEAVARIAAHLNDLPTPLARALALRGVTEFEEARTFFRPSLERLHDPFLMRDMEQAADRVAEACRRGERVLVYGDYDVDGTTATALMTHFLRTCGAEVSYFIPDRIEHGYGLGEAGFDIAKERGASLVVALDCGITAFEAADYARRQGLDLVICDHHTAHDEVPDALAVLDPKRPGCPYPFKELSGAGVGFKLVQAVLARLGLPQDRCYRYLDLLAVSIAADIVPVVGENRILASEGLKRLRESAGPGLRALAEIAGVDLRQAVSTSKVVFRLGPRINAAGRMGSADRAVELMLAEDDETARKAAYALEELNKQRQEVDRATQEAARRQAERQITSYQRNAMVLYSDDWHPGVIGIVASRMVERFYRPTVMLCAVGGVVKGSARSVRGVSIYDALEACKDLLIQFGGHKYAAGLTIAEENIPAFRERFDEAVGEVVTADTLHPVLDIDADLDLRDVDRRFRAVLKQFAPFGPHNSEPIFRAKGLEVVGNPRTVGQSGGHLKCRVRQAGDAESPSFDVIGFGLGDRLPVLHESRGYGKPLEMVFALEENEWRGQQRLQLKAKDVRLEG